MSLVFWWGLDWLCISPWQYGHFGNTNAAVCEHGKSSWQLEKPAVSFLSVLYFHHVVTSWPWIGLFLTFDSFGGLYECDLVLDFFLSRFIIGKQKSYWLSYIEFVSCYFAENIYQIKSQTLSNSLGILTIGSHHVKIEITELLFFSFFPLSYHLAIAFYQSL